MMTIDQAQAAATAAKKAYEDYVEMVRQEAEAAARAVKAKYQDEVSALSKANSEASQALRAAKNEQLPDHEWNGRRVYRMVNSRRHGYRTNFVRQYGIVETRRTETNFPANTPSYRTPSIGEGFVRLLKKDGTLGSKFDSLYTAWALDDETPSA